MKTKINPIKKIFFTFLYIILFVSCEYEINLDGEGCESSPTNPPYKEACISYNTEDTACCYATIEFQNQTKANKCLPVPRDARFALNFLTIFSFEDYNGLEYKDVTAVFECGQKDKICGMNSPEQIFQCSEHSSTTQSCCYLSTPTYTECVLSDKKYYKETIFKLFDNSTIVCKSDTIKIKKHFWFILFIFIIYDFLLL